MVRRILYFLNIIVLLGCSESIEPSLIQDFFPISDGQYWEYGIEEISYSLTQEPQIKNYFRRESLILLSESEYKIEIAIKSSENAPWNITQVDLLSISGNRIIQTTNSKPEIIFNKPASEGLKWNKNSLNTENEIILQSAKFGTEYGFFKNTVHIIEKQDSSLID